MTPETAAALTAATDAREAAEAELGTAWERLVDLLGTDEEAAGVEAVEAAELAVDRARIVERGWARRAHVERPFVAEEEPDPRGVIELRAIAPCSDPSSPRRIIAPGQRFTVPADRAELLVSLGTAELAPGQARPEWWNPNLPSSLRVSSA